MTDLNRKFSRKLLCLAVAGACAGSAYARPTGPLVNAGSASYDPATLTVTSATTRTQISWQSFHVAPGEVVNFVQPNAQSAVLNQVFNPQALNILGGLNSNGSVLFMSNGRVSGAGVNLDLAGLISTSLRLPKMALAYTGVEALAQPRPLATLAAGSIYVISQDEHAVSAANGDVVLNAGKSVELVGAAMPNLRVELTAPAAEAINLSRLLGGKRETGIFAGLFRVPAAARQAVQRDAGAISVASAHAHDLERFYRYALLYARMRGETLQQEVGLLQVAAAPTGTTTLAAIKSRSSLLPREIEIGAPRPQELALRATSSLLAAKLEAPAATRATQAAAIAAENEAKGESAPLLAFAAVEPPAEMIATRSPQPVAIAAASAVHTDSAMQLAYASVEPPAEMVATRTPQPVAVAVASAAQADSAIVLAYAPGEPPAEMVATRTPQPVAVAVASAAQADSAMVLAYAPGEPPAEMVATRTPQPIAVAATNAPRADSGITLAYAPVELPAEMVATRTAQPVAVAVASAAQADAAPVLALAPAEPPARRVLPVPGETEPATSRYAPRLTPAVVVVALAQQKMAPAPREVATVKEVRIERRAPRYFTDYRGAMFFM